MNIVAEFLGFLRPDNRINLKESRILGIPLPAHHLPILRKMLATAFTLGDSLHDGRQRVLLDEDDTGLLHDLRQGAGRLGNAIIVRIYSDSNRIWHSTKNKMFVVARCSA